VPDTTSGLGWTLELYETLAATYRFSHEHILWHLPLARAFALLVASRHRQGHKATGPTYQDLDIIDELNRRAQSEPSD
jgi:hypothetical protein